ncbi:MAG: hypothetical protein ACD_2C00209G0002 [uncultured bacterium (gcode 4)]|uniref:Uncharacterized protein n=1 Tax=uncultured bacterium (gcode 4) TaxID=1234023 RepID=K2G1X6_9BACT|nr:MAG: hypothetical protein ACD_2C00209G0002 [uncultured bacterium (gcode 4)]
MIISAMNSASSENSSKICSVWNTTCYKIEACKIRYNKQITAIIELKKTKDASDMLQVAQGLISDISLLVTTGSLPYELKVSWMHYIINWLGPFVENDSSDCYDLSNRFISRNYLSNIFRLNKIHDSLLIMNDKMMNDFFWELFWMYKKEQYNLTLSQLLRIQRKYV